MLPELDARINEIIEEIELGRHAHSQIEDGSSVSKIDCMFSLSIYEKHVSLLTLMELREQVYGISCDEIKDIRKEVELHRENKLGYMAYSFSGVDNAY